MALIKCPECGKEISDKAVACINCGCPVSAMKSAPAQPTESTRPAMPVKAAEPAKQAVDTANESLKISRTSARFKYHEATKQVSIKIVDDETQEVIKEIPPEKAIEMVEKMLELSGILVDEKR